jgi:hypothetical protein
MAHFYNENGRFRGFCGSWRCGVGLLSTHKHHGGYIMNSVLSFSKTKSLVVALGALACMQLSARVALKNPELEAALKENNVVLLNKALAAGANANEPAADGTPLARAVRYKSHDVLKELLKRSDIQVNYGGGLYSVCPSMVSPLALAVQLNDAMALGMLLAHPSVIIGDETLKQIIIYRNITGIEHEGLKKLLAHPKVDLMQCDEHGKTLLDYEMEALLNEASKLSRECLLGKGSDLLMYHVRFIELLLETKKHDVLSLAKARTDLVTWLVRKGLYTLEDYPCDGGPCSPRIVPAGGPLWGLASAIAELAANSRRSEHLLPLLWSRSYQKSCII